MADSWLTEKQLLAQVAEAGYPDVTAWQIDRWRKRRLFSATRPSRGWYGSETLYPPETVQHVLAICRLKQRFPHNLELLRFLLWCEGYSLPLPDIKQAIKRFVGKALQLLAAHATELPVVAE